MDYPHFQSSFSIAMLVYRSVDPKFWDSTKFLGGMFDIPKSFMDFRDTKKTLVQDSHPALFHHFWQNCYRALASLHPRHWMSRANKLVVWKSGNSSWIWLFYAILRYFWYLSMLTVRGVRAFFWNLMTGRTHQGIVTDSINRLGFLPSSVFVNKFISSPFLMSHVFFEWSLG